MDHVTLELRFPEDTQLSAATAQWPIAYNLPHQRQRFEAHGHLWEAFDCFWGVDTEVPRFVCQVREVGR